MSAPGKLKTAAEAAAIEAAAKAQTSAMEQAAKADAPLVAKAKAQSAASVRVRTTGR